jgi:hypothetical protein
MDDDAALRNALYRQIRWALICCHCDRAISGVREMILDKAIDEGWLTGASNYVICGECAKECERM